MGSDCRHWRLEEFNLRLARHMEDAGWFPALYFVFIKAFGIIQ
jgi:hypothetical protein